MLQYGPNSSLLPASAVSRLADDVVGRVKSLDLFGIQPDLTGNLAATLLAAARR